MHCDPLHRIRSAGRVQLQLRQRENVAIRIIRVEGDRYAINRHLERLQLAAFGKIRLVVWHEPVDKGIRLARIFRTVRISRIDRHGNTACIFNNQDVPLIVRMNSFITSLAEDSVQRRYHWRPTWGHLNDTAI